MEEDLFACCIVASEFLDTHLSDEISDNDAPLTPVIERRLLTCITKYG